MLRKIIQTGNSSTVILIRIMVGAVFLSEGLQKYILPGSTGTGRFIAIGFNHPAFWAYFAGAFEIVCGILIVLGLFTRLAVIPLLAVMTVAFISTKVPILSGKGFWSFAHEYRTDFSMTIGCIFLFITGSGKWSLDKKIASQKWKL